MFQDEIEYVNAPVLYAVPPIYKDVERIYPSPVFPVVTKSIESKNEPSGEL